jgi:hypothetical protein
MKRVLQHSKTGLYLGADGRFTNDVSQAWCCPSLADAMIVCSQFSYRATDFVYRMVEPNPVWARADLAALQTAWAGLRA